MKQSKQELCSILRAFSSSIRRFSGSIIKFLEYPLQYPLQLLVLHVIPQAIVYQQDHKVPYWITLPGRSRHHSTNLYEIILFNQNNQLSPFIHSGIPKFSKISFTKRWIHFIRHSSFSSTIHHFALELKLYQLIFIPLIPPSHTS